MTPNRPESEHSVTEQDSTSAVFLVKRIMELEDDIQRLDCDDASTTPRLQNQIRTLHEELHDLRRQLRAAERRERQ